MKFRLRKLILSCGEMKEWEMGKVLMTEDLWKRLEEKTNTGFFKEKLIIGEDEIIIAFRVGKIKNFFCIFINGVCKGKEKPENEEKYHFEKKIMKTKKLLDFYKNMAKASTGEEKKKYTENYTNKISGTYFSPFFMSFRTLKSTYKKRHKEIYWVVE